MKKKNMKKEFGNQKKCNAITCIHQVAGRCILLNRKEECLDFFEKQLLQEN